MSKVINYLDCGCAILEDGSRSWCPTCSSPPPAVKSELLQRLAGKTGDCDILAAAVVAYFDAMAVCDGPIQPNWRAVAERARAAARNLAKLAGACWHDEMSDLQIKWPDMLKLNANEVPVGVTCKKCGKVLVQA